MLFFFIKTVKFMFWVQFFHFSSFGVLLGCKCCFFFLFWLFWADFEPIFDGFKLTLLLMLGYQVLVAALHLLTFFHQKKKNTSANGKRPGLASSFSSSYILSSTFLSILLSTSRSIVVISSLSILLIHTPCSFSPSSMCSIFF